MAGCRCRAPRPGSGVAPCWSRGAIFGSPSRLVLPSPWELPGPNYAPRQSREVQPRHVRVTKVSLSRHECSGCMHGAGGEGRGQEAWEADPSGCLSQGLSSRGRVQPEGPGRPKRPGGRAPGKAGSLVQAEVLRMEAPVSRCSRKEAPSERQPGWSPRCGDRSRWTCPPRSSGQRPGGGDWLPRSRETGLWDHPLASRPTFPAPAFTP